MKRVSKAQRSTNGTLSLCLPVRLHPCTGKHRKNDRREYRDDSYDNQQFKQGEALLKLHALFALLSPQALTEPDAVVFLASDANMVRFNRFPPSYRGAVRPAPPQTALKSEGNVLPDAGRAASPVVSFQYSRSPSSTQLPNRMQTIAPAAR